ELWRRHQREYVALIRKKLKYFPAISQDDAVQDAAEKLLRECRKFDPAVGQWGGWAAVLVRNLCQDLIRRNRPAGPLPADVVYAPDLYAAVDAFLELLDDEPACEARAALLRHHGATGNAHRFTAEYRLLASGDLATAMADGTLNARQFADLACDPDALLLARR